MSAAASGNGGDIFGIVARADVNALQRILARDPAVVHARDTHGDTPLHRLCSGSFEDGALPRGVDRDAVASEIADLLLEAGADGNAVGALGRRPLHECCIYGRTRLALRLLSLPGPLLDEQDAEGKTPLNLAARHGRTSIAAILIGKGADPHSRDDTGRTPLIRAAVRDYVEILELLLAGGADPNAADGGGMTALHEARGRPRSLRALLSYRVDVNAKTWEGLTPLDLAEHDAEGQILLLRHGGHTSRRWDPSRLVSWEPDPDDPFGLIAAADVKGLLDLLERRPDRVRHRDEEGRTPLHRVIYRFDAEAEEGLRRPRVVQLEVLHTLLAADADQTAVDRHGRTPLLLACGLGQRRGVGLALRLLEEPEAPVNLPDARGRTPLLRAIRRFGSEVPRALVRRGADVDAVDSAGYRALHRAVTLGDENLEVVHLLLDAGAEVNARTREGWTPLDLADFARADAVSESLIEEGGVNGPNPP